MRAYEKHGMGWLPDYPDFRDYTVERDKISSKLVLLGQKESIKAMLLKVGVTKPEESTLPDKKDLREWCSPIEDQLRLGSCTAQAGVALVEYYERRASGNHIDASRLFLYKTARNLLHLTGDTGAFIRTTMGAMVLFGVPPEEFWPYTEEDSDFDREPPPFCYAYAQSYRTIQYVRLDPPKTPPKSILTQIKTYLAAGLPSMFGFAVYSSIEQVGQDGKIPYPTNGETLLGGHAIVAVGYDDRVEIRNAGSDEPTKGALLIRNSWGREWGEKGYGWLPYKYVEEGLAEDWWTLLKNEWIDTGAFKL